MERGEKMWSKVSYQKQPRSLKQSRLALDLVLYLVLCLLEIAIFGSRFFFEVNAWAIKAFALQKENQTFTTYTILAYSLTLKSW